MMGRVSRLPIAMIMLGAAACTTGPEPRESRFPVLQLSRADDATLDCANIRDQVEKAAALHREIGREEAGLVREDTLWGGFGVATEPVSGLVTWAYSGVAAQQRAARYEASRIAAQKRISALLELPQTEQCGSPLAPAGVQLAALKAMPQNGREALKKKRQTALAFFDSLAANPATSP